MTSTGGGGGTDTQVPFSGKVLAGGRPATGASVQLYEASMSGYGAASVPLLSTAAITDSLGGFSISGAQYNCASASNQLYLLASGGNSNGAQVLMTALGNCGGIASGASYTVNEVTSVAAIWSLAPFAQSPTAIGTSSTNVVGLEHAFQVAAMLADTTSGVSPASALPSRLSVSSAKIYSLANALSGCAASASACSSLFSVATFGGSVPTSTATAALAIAQHPGSNVSSFYIVASGSVIYSGLHSAPSDWTISIESTAGGLSSPTGLAIDSTGRAWVANEAGGLQLYSAMGTPVFSTPITGHGLAAIIAVAVDSKDNVWAGNDANGTITEVSSNGTVLSSGSGFGPSYTDPLGLAGDSNGNMWVVDYGDGSLFKLSSAGANTLGPYYGPTIDPEAVALDAASTPWVAGQDGSVTHRDANGNVSAHATCCVLLTGISIDPSGNPWVSDFRAPGIVEISATTGAAIRTITSVGGLSSPNNISIDGTGNVFVPNLHGMSFSEVAGVTNTSPAQALSPSTGYGRDTLMAEPFTTALDASGTLWVTSTSDNRLLRYIGIAAPTKTPLLGPAALP